MSTDPSNGRAYLRLWYLIAVSLGATALLSVGGSIYLAAHGVETPLALATISGVAVGALAALPSSIRPYYAPSPGESPRPS